jgi:cytochrome c oxidase subunit 2
VWIPGSAKNDKNKGKVMTVWSAAVVTLVGALAIFLITIWLIAGAGSTRPVESVSAGLLKMRGRYFVALMVALVVLLGVTLTNLPYRSMVPVEPDYTVSVNGAIWSWKIGPITDSSGNATQSGNEPVVLPVGAALEFQVTAEDVNHGFGIYDEAGRLLAQTQAMPGYVNRLVHTFTEPGTYHVLCMEYCGVGHHTMMASITVESEPGREAP